MQSRLASRPVSSVPEELLRMEPNDAVIRAGLAWLRAALDARIGDLRASRPQSTHGTGTPNVLSDEDADWLLRTPVVPRPSAAHGAAADARRAYDAARAARIEVGEPAAIDRLSSLFGLAPFDEDVLLLTLAPSLDPAFAALYGYVHDRISITTATPYLALTLLAMDAPSARARLRPLAPLRRFALITVGEMGSGGALTPIHVDERICDYLLGESYIDPSVAVCLHPVDAGLLPAAHEPIVRDLLGQFSQTRRAEALLLGSPRSGRRAVAGALAGALRLRLLQMDPRWLPPAHADRRARFALLAREAALADFAVLIDADPDVHGPNADEEAMQARRAAADALAMLEAPLFIIGRDRLAGGRRSPTLRLKPLDAGERTTVWQAAFADGRIGEATLARIAEQFALGPSEIVTVAGSLGTRDLSEAALWERCREAADRRLDDLAERIEARCGWDDIVLPSDVMDDLQALAAQVRHRADVYGRWGFGEKLIRNRGVGALFAGPSGVGKTMAAEVIAGHLGLDLYRIDLSGVVSKYIGETEKNLRRIFDAAEGAGAILFFDEADALFGKRSEVKDSHDRYANIEVSYLLQRMEAYTGLAILATNMKTHLDTAFLRRLRFVIDFPFPDAALRCEIWRRAFPPKAPLDRLDLPALARLEIAGGNIQVIAVNAAFLAAAEDKPIGMDHVFRAARSEFRKIDKEFRPVWSEGRAIP